ncbi:unnamed protein product [Cladocopium goreaui]|uniref:Uncharacterized protein n=1 Tax=Cladocopium goreaui TaxID=2562237 RepID=A0A9P1GEQ0_9DINO|nr:unnamed protein product [Cladocopium goreaui]
MTDSFDLWGASLCWADEAMVDQDSEWVLTWQGGVAPPEAVPSTASERELNILSTQDIIDHEASFDCGGSLVRQEKSERCSDTASSRCIRLMFFFFQSQSDGCDWHSPVDVAADAPSESWPAMPATCPAQETQPAAIESHQVRLFDETQLYVSTPQGLPASAADHIAEIDRSLADAKSISGAAQETLVYEVDNAGVDPEAACVIPGAAQETLVYEVDNAGVDPEAACVIPGAAQETLVYEEVGQPEGVNTLEYIAATQSSPSQLGAVDSETLLYPVSEHFVTVSTVATPVRQGTYVANTSGRYARDARLQE